MSKLRDKMLARQREIEEVLAKSPGFHSDRPPHPRGCPCDVCRLWEANHPKSTDAFWPLSETYSTASEKGPLDPALGHSPSLAGPEPKPAPKWTKEPPQAPGWYWYRSVRTHEARIMHIPDAESPIYLIHPSDREADEVEWNGPLECPS